MRALAKRKFLLSLAIWFLAFFILVVGIVLSLFVRTYSIFGIDASSLVFVLIIMIVCISIWHLPKLAHKLKKEAITLYQGANLLDKCSTSQELSDEEAEILAEAEFLYEWLTEKG